MSSLAANNRKLLPYKTLLEENLAVSAENQALKAEIENLRARLEEAGELERAITEGDLDALIIPGQQGELVFTLDSADRAYRILVETMNEGTTTIAFDGTILYCNSRFAELLKLPLNSITGKSVYQHIAPEDMAYFKALLESKIGSGEVKLITADGKFLPVYMSISSLQNESPSNAWCLVVTDLTEQKKNEEIVAAERLARSIIEQTSEAIAVCDTSGRIIRFSNAMLKLCGFNPELQSFEYAINLRSSNLAKGDNIILPVSSALSGSILKGLEVSYTREDSQTFDLLLNSGPLKNEAGEIIGCVLTLTDITHRKQIEDSLHDAIEQIQAQSNELQMQSDELQTRNEALKAVSRELQTKNEELQAQAEEIRVQNEELQVQAEELRETNEALIKSEERFHTLFETMTEGFALHEIITDEQGKPCDYRFLDVNPSFERLTGLKRTDLIGKRVLEVLPGTEPHWIDNYGRVTLTGEPLHMENYSSDLDRWYEVLAYRTMPGQFAVIISDITKRKRAEEALIKAHRQIQNIIDNTPDIVYAFDLEGRFSLANRAVANVLNSTPDRMIGKRRHEFMPKKDADWHEANDRQVLVEGRVLEFEEYSQLEGRMITWLTKKFPLYDAQGRIYAVAGISADISERKRAEEALKIAHDTLEEKVKERTAELEEAYDSLLENELRLSEAQKIAHLGNWVWDPQTDELFWSDEVYRIFGTDPLKFGGTYNAFLDCVHPEDRGNVISAIKEAFNGKPFAIDHRIIRENGEERIVYLHGSAIFSVKNVPLRMKGIVQDITERKKAQEALENLEKIRIKEIHHRIKNNLQVISSLLDLQAEKFEDESVVEAFKEGQNRVVSMALIHEELYKGEGKDKLDFSTYLKKLAESLFSTYRINTTDVLLHLDLEENAFLNMDTAVPLGIIVNELVSNSLKHAFNKDEAGEIQIQLCRGKMVGEAGTSLFSLTVSDNGKGIPEDLDIENVDSLGLQLVTILVDQLDGEIELNREQGTEFRVTFSIQEDLCPA